MRRRWVQIDGELVEVTNDYKGAIRTNTDGVLWNDRNYQDVGDSRFSSRSQHRQFMKDNGLTIADDFAGEWKAAEKKRDAHYTNAPDATRRRDMYEALAKVKNGHKPTRYPEE